MSATSSTEINGQGVLDFLPLLFVKNIIDFYKDI